MPSILKNVALFAAVVSAAVPAPYPTSSASLPASTSTSRVQDSVADPSKASAAWSIVNKSKSSSTSKSTSISKSSSASKSVSVSKSSSGSASVPASSQASTISVSPTSSQASTISVPPGCPSVLATYTTSYTADKPYDTKFVIPVTTITLSQDTYTRTFTTFGVTNTISSPGVDPSTSTYYPRVNHTNASPTQTFTETICTATSTTSIPYTSTVYTGGPYSSAVSTGCSTITVSDVYYPGGTTTSTATSSFYPNPSFLTSYVEGGTTEITSFDSTATSTSTVTDEVYITSGSTTYSQSIECTSTAFIGRSNATTTTQAAKCAPTNLIENVAYIPHFNDKQSFGPSANTVDASQCCQLCADNELCSAMYWSRGFCSTRVASEGAECGDAIVVEFGTEGNDLTMAPGCGRIVEFGGYLP